jgi:rhodanese-related sulfurtransferase
MRIFVALFFLFLPATLAFAAEPVKIPAKEASEWLAKTPEVQVVDVRTAEEFAGGHLAKAVMISWTEPGFEACAKKLDSKKPVLVYCRSGRRSAAAATALAKLGFIEIRDLDGGIVAWEKSGKPLVKPE